MPPPVQGLPKETATERPLWTPLSVLNLKLERGRAHLRGSPAAQVSARAQKASRWRPPLPAVPEDAGGILKTDPDKGGGGGKRPTHPLIAGEEGEADPSTAAKSQGLFSRKVGGGYLGTCPCFSGCISPKGGGNCLTPSPPQRDAYSWTQNCEGREAESRLAVQRGPPEGWEARGESVGLSLLPPPAFSSGEGGTRPAAPAKVCPPSALCFWLCNWILIDLGEADEN